MDPRLVRSVGMTMRTALTLLLAGIALLAAAGCGEDDEAASAATPKLSGAIKYEVIGGDAFRDDKITVQADGNARVQTRSGTTTVELTAAERSDLAREVQAAKLAKAKSEVTDQPFPDMVSYTFTYRGRTVETDAGALPDQLRALIGTFDDLIDRYGAKRK